MIAEAPPAVSGAVLTHATVTFHFIVHASLSKVAPLFGPEGERAWAGPEWNPEFIHPAVPKDVPGAVFRLKHGPHVSIWVNTLFDLAAGRIQYVTFVPGMMTSTIDVTLRPDGSSTRATVSYARTALSVEANEHILALSKADEAKGGEWRDAIAAALRGRQTP